jgi:hypothetical protein
MTQADLDRALARVTGESMTLIRRMGFILLTPHARRRGRPARSSTRRPPTRHPAVPATRSTACPE